MPRECISSSSAAVVLKETYPAVTAPPMSMRAAVGTAIFQKMLSESSALSLIDRGKILSLP